MNELPTIPLKKNKEEIIHKYNIIGEGYRRIIISGASGTGKTHYLRVLLPILYPPDYIIIYSSNIYQEIFNCIKSYFKKNIMLIDDVELLGEIIEMLKNKGDYMHTIIIIDDYNKKVEELTKNLFCQGRHSNFSTILINQNYFEISTTTRRNADMLIIFPITGNINHIAFDVGLSKFDFMDYYKECMDGFNNDNYTPLIYDSKVNINDCRRIRKSLLGILKNI